MKNLASILALGIRTLRTLNRMCSTIRNPNAFGIRAPTVLQKVDKNRFGLCFINYTMNIQWGSESWLELLPGLWITNKWKFVFHMFLLFRCSLLRVIQMNHGLNIELLPSLWVANKWKFVFQMFLLFRCSLLRVIQIPTFFAFSKAAKFFNFSFELYFPDISTVGVRNPNTQIPDSIVFNHLLISTIWKTDQIVWHTFEIPTIWRSNILTVSISNMFSIVRIWIPDQFGCQMVESSLVVKWSSFQWVRNKMTFYHSKTKLE